MFDIEPHEEATESVLPMKTADDDLYLYVAETRKMVMQLRDEVAQLRAELHEPKSPMELYAYDEVR